ncbi:MAG TPA: PAS domain S-box protein, partial [Candidatus Acidoferrum sp.]|nr:PAS domain S-box protein [Candidatus Acidoferrum sp.]
MSWITFIWSMTSGICLTLGAVHFVVWTRRRDEWANLVFSITAAAAAGYAVLDLLALRAQTPAEYGEWMRWMLLLGMVEGVLIACFIRLYLRAGRLWLFWLICGLRVLMLVLNFVAGPNFYFREITAVHPMPLLGELISHPHGVLHPWAMLMQLSLLLIIVFAIDAARTAAKRSEGPRAWVLGGLVAVGFSLALVSYALYALEILPSTFSSQLFLSLIVVMGYELSLDVLRAGQLSRDLIESQQRMRLAASSADLSIWEWDIVRDEIWTTEKGRERAGLGAYERIDFARYLQSVHPEDREPTQRAVRQALEGRGEFEAEYRVVGREGATRWVVARGHVERNTQGKPLRLRGVSVDVTERKRAEESARNAQELMAAVFNSVPGLLYLYTEDGRLIQWNRQHEVMTGYTAEELLGFRIQGWFDEENWAQASKVLAKIFSEGYAQTEITLKRKNGEELPLFATGSRVMIDGKPHMVGIATDISLRKQADAELRRLQGEVAHVSRVSTMGQLSTALAHELNQPLGAILSNAEAAEMLLEADPPALGQVREILADIRKDDERAGEVIRRMRALLRKRELEIQSLDLGELIHNVLGLVSGDAALRKVTVRAEVDSRPLPIRGDRVHLQQVLLNLLVNALDAVAGNPSEERRVSVQAARNRAGEIEVSVIDNGPGIPPAQLARLFEPFFTTKPDGMGMGISIARTIVQAHNGRIWAE